jgi:NADH dehydrogenase
MQKVVIIGGGFAGLACADALRRCSPAQVTVVDKSPTSDFLPLLPDILGGRISPAAARFSLAVPARRNGFSFVQDEVNFLDVGARQVHGLRGQYDYDYAVIAAGSQTNFYGGHEIARVAFTLDHVSDAERIRAAVGEPRFKTIVVAGGGYTGVEIATNLRRRFAREKSDKRIVLVESSDAVLGALPEWMRQYAVENLVRMDVEVSPHCKVEAAGPDHVLLSNGTQYDRAMLIWAAGVQTPSFVRDLHGSKTRQGRMEVDESLRLEERIYCVGDCAHVMHAGQPLRMSVQFALAQGRLAGENIVRNLRGVPARRYQPRDLGYVVPMANLRSCGVALGRNVRGLPASLLHYLMCVYRSRGLAQKFRVLGDLLQA